MAAEAEAAREARAKVRFFSIQIRLSWTMDIIPIFSHEQVIAAEGEQKASRALKEASEVIAESSSALQLRYLQVMCCFNAQFSILPLWSLIVISYCTVFDSSLLLLIFFVCSSRLWTPYRRRKTRQLYSHSQSTSSSISSRSQRKRRKRTNNNQSLHRIRIKVDPEFAEDTCSPTPLRSRNT